MYYIQYIRENKLHMYILFKYIDKYINGNIDNSIINITLYPSLYDYTKIIRIIVHDL